MHDAKDATETKRGPGRPHGSKSQRTHELIDTLRAKGYDPVAKLIELHTEAETRYREHRERADQARASNDIKLVMAASQEESAAYAHMRIMKDIAVDIIPYLYAKRASVKHEIETDGAGAIPVMFYLPSNGRSIQSD